MPFNMDFNRPVHIITGEQPWMASPLPGVERIPLAREDAERGHATSIVRYQPGARFHSHNHPGGEEILVLSGTFSDETGDFPAGTYFRNPIGFQHAPFSDAGCTLLVKLHQFQTHDQHRLSIQTDHGNWQATSHGVQQQMLHQHDKEQVQMLQVNKGCKLPLTGLHHALEMYVLQGALQPDSAKVMDQPAALLTDGSWWRSPAASGEVVVFNALSDVVVWVKSGHF